LHFVPITFHNPTQRLNKLFALAIVFLYFKHFIDARRAARRPVAAIAGLSVLSALAKPSFLLAFCPTRRNLRNARPNSAPWAASGADHRRRASGRIGDGLAG
jgi:hypothetical protein